MTKWWVVCTDGAVRHHTGFDSPWTAQNWANWGHCCVIGHVIKHEFPPPDPETAYYFIKPEEGGWEDIEAMWIAEDAMNGDM